MVWAISTNVDPARDVTMVENTPIDSLDFASPEAGLGAKMGIDATAKMGPETQRAWGRPIRMRDDIIEEVTRKWEAYGLPAAAGPSGSNMSDPRTLAENGKAWPFAEARSLLKRLGADVPEKGYALFETGYGPSGLPHIGTFAEVARTSMVRHAFQALSDTPTRLFAFSDDMDGLRKVPDNVPDREMMAEHLGKPLTAIPDPFGTHESFGAQTTPGFALPRRVRIRLRVQELHGVLPKRLFDSVLLSVLERYDAVIDVILPTLGPERRATYSPFLPVSAKTGRVLEAPWSGAIQVPAPSFMRTGTGTKSETPVTGGAASSSGRWIGPCAGRRLAWITRCRARI